MARKAFHNEKVFSEVTGVNEELIHRLKICLIAVNSHLPVDAMKYKAYAKETIQLYNQHYSWYYMCPTVHKLLAHGADIIGMVNI